jgi:DivIVA domain-containing protein
MAEEKTKDNKRTIELTPNRIKTVEFNVVRKGYSADEVDAFLEKVASEYETFGIMLNSAYEKEWQANQKAKQLQKRIDELEARVAEQNSSYSSLAMQVYGEDKNTGSTLSDALRRIDRLEKTVYGEVRKI